MNGNAENPIQSSIIYKPLSGETDEKEDDENSSSGGKSVKKFYFISKPSSTYLSSNLLDTYLIT